MAKVPWGVPEMGSSKRKVNPFDKRYNLVEVMLKRWGKPRDSVGAAAWSRGETERPKKSSKGEKRLTESEVGLILTERRSD